MNSCPARRTPDLVICRKQGAGTFIGDAPPVPARRLAPPVRRSRALGRGGGAGRPGARAFGRRPRALPRRPGADRRPGGGRRGGGPPRGPSPPCASGTPDWAPWDAAVSARIPSAALRAASRAQGAALLRTVALAFPTPAVAALRALPRVHHPLVLGAAAAAAGADPGQAAALALHHLVGGAATAAVRLLGLDPLRVTAVTVGRRAGRPTPWPPMPPRSRQRPSPRATRRCCPTEGSPLTDVLAELHRASEATLFAS